jgi:RNA polymerase sigma-70 factor (ECF subfamily)
MPEQDNDFDLIQRFLAGDEAAFNKIVSKYQQKIYWHARRMVGNHIDADEIVQEVLLVLYKKLASFKFKSSLYTWIYKITSTRSLNLLRQRKVKEFFSFEDSEDHDISGGQDIVATLESKEKIEKLERVLKTLPAKQREVFILRHFDELSYEEISAITGKSVGGLKANYFHAFKKINDLMNNND